MISRWKHAALLYTCTVPGTGTIQVVLPVVEQVLPVVQVERHKKMYLQVVGDPRSEDGTAVLLNKYKSVRTLGRSTSVANCYSLDLY